MLTDRLSNQCQSRRNRYAFSALTLTVGGILIGCAIAACGSSTRDMRGPVGGAGPGSSSPDASAGQTPAPSDDPTTYAWQALVPPPGDFVITDQETGSTFNLRGEAIAGPLADEKRLLQQVPGVNMFWFAWSVHYPGSEVWGRSEKVRQAALPADKTGNVGCGGGRDCIPSLPNVGPPEEALPWVAPDSSGAEYLDDEDLVLGVFIDGVARAYPHNIFWWHEIANDQIGDKRYSVTFCPLTGSGAMFAATESGYTFGVSGQLFNSNLVMYDHVTRALWPQLWMGPVNGEGAGEKWLEQMALSEMTWKRWRELHPDTLVLSDETGFSRDYTRYPYGDFRTDHSSTFRLTDPLPDPMYPNKTMTFGLIDRASGALKAYVHSDLAAQGERAVINDTFNGKPIVIVYEKASRLALAFERATEDHASGELTFEATAFEPNR